MSEKLKNLLVRTASGAVLLLVVVGALLLSKWTAAALFAAIMIGGLIEFYKLCQARGYKPNYVVGVLASLIIFSIVLVAFYVTNDVPNETSDVAHGLTEMVYVMICCCPLGALALSVLTPALFIAEMWRKSETPIANIATTFMGALYVSLPMALILVIPYILCKEWNPWAMLAFISIIWVNDVFAYLVGVSIGKHRLCERISPKKSWEGFFGGLIGAVGAAVLFGYLLDGNLYVWGGLGLVTALFGVAGDLVESMFKREAGVKDSGNIIPGHGGILDRFDALFMAVPFAFIYLLFTQGILA